MMKKLLTFALVALFTLAAYAQSNVKTIVHLKSGEKLEYLTSDIDSISFKREQAPDPEPNTENVEMEVKYMSNSYQGDGVFLMRLSDQPLTKDGIPTVVGQRVINYYALAEAVDDPKSDITLPAGTYKSNNNYKNFTLYHDAAKNGYLCVTTCTGFDEYGALGRTTELDYAELVVAYSGDECTLDFKGGLTYPVDEETFTTIHASYKGTKCEFSNDVEDYKKLDHNLVLEPTHFRGIYSQTSSLDNWTLKFSSTQLNDYDEAYEAGWLVNFELLTNPVEEMSMEALCGNYTIGYIYGNLEPGRFMSGVLYDHYGYLFPMGTYYGELDSYGYHSMVYGFVTGGSVSISDAGNGNIHFVANLFTETLNTIKIDTTVPFSSISPRQTAPAKKPESALTSSVKLNRNSAEVETPKFFLLKK